MTQDLQWVNGFNSCISKLICAVKKNHLPLKNILPMITHILFIQMKR